MAQHAERLKEERIAQAATLAARRLTGDQADAAARSCASSPRTWHRRMSPPSRRRTSTGRPQPRRVRRTADARHAEVRACSARAADADGWSCRHTVVEIVNDDMPFLSTRSRPTAAQDLAVHLVVHPVVAVERDGDRLVAVGRGAGRESMMHIEVAALADPERREQVRAGLLEVLGDVRRAVADWPAMRDRMVAAQARLEAEGAGLPADERAEADAFLEWLVHDHFTFLGCREYVFGTAAEAGAGVAIVPGSGLGVLGAEEAPVFDGLRHFTTLPAEVQQFLRRPTALVVTKSSHKARVHRAIPMDVIAVKRFDADGAPVGLSVFAGLYTSAAYSAGARTIPILWRRSPGSWSGPADPNSHDGKRCCILDTYRATSCSDRREALFAIAQTGGASAGRLFCGTCSSASCRVTYAA
jgi:glutamate dehydrogenase